MNNQDLFNRSMHQHDEFADNQPNPPTTVQGPNLRNASQFQPIANNTLSADPASQSNTPVAQNNSSSVVQGSQARAGRRQEDVSVSPSPLRGIQIPNRFNANENANESQVQLSNQNKQSLRKKKTQKSEATPDEFSTNNPESKKRRSRGQPSQTGGPKQTENWIKKDQGEPTIIDQMNEIYQRNKEKIDLDRNNLDTVEELIEKFKKERIKVYKYNYNIDERVQNFRQFEAYLQLSQDGRYLKIVNLKPITNPQYVLEADPNVVEQMRLDNQEAQKHELVNEELDFNKKESSASCDLDDLNGILYGAISSRYWMLRKHINSLEISKISDEDIPFQSWQCISLNLKHRDVDLVIKDEQHMTELITILVHHMQSVNNVKNSKQWVSDTISKYKIREARNELGRSLSQTAKKRLGGLTDNEKLKLLKTTVMKYKIMRIRAKISFMAFHQNITIQELVVKQIMQSNLEIAEQMNNQSILKGLNKIEQGFHTLMKCDMSQTLKVLMRINAEKSDDKYFINIIKQDEAISDLFKKSEKIKVKKKGDNTVKFKEIDEEHNMQKVAKVQTLIDKDNADDIFQYTNFGEQDQIFETKNFKKVIEFKKNRHSLNAKFERIKLVLNLKAVDKVLFIKLLLKKIELAKEIFILEIEQGQEVFIPAELSIDQYPMSFRFYDMILNFTKEAVSQETKEFHSFKNTFRLNFYQNENVQQKMLEKLGIVDAPIDSTDVNKLTFRHAIVNEKNSSEINHTMSLHAKSLQKSRYLSIDDDIQRLQLHFAVQSLCQKHQMRKAETIGGGGMKTNIIPKSSQKNSQTMAMNNDKLILRYCLPKEVNQKRQKNLQWKSTFLAKIRHLKHTGKNQEILEKIDEWIDDTFQYKNTKKIPGETQDDTNKRHHQEYKKFQAAKADLLTEAEALLKDSGLDRRHAYIQEIRDFSDPKMDYRSKQRFIDQNIQVDIKYFNNKEGMKILMRQRMQMQQALEKKNAEVN